MKPRVIDIKAPALTAESGEALLSRAKTDLGIWGGMHHSTTPDAEGDVSVGFDPATAKGGLPGVIRWLDSLGCEWTATLSAWAE